MAIIGRRKKFERQMEREFAFHLEREAAEARADGLDESAARRAAGLALGSAERWKEESREEHVGTWRNAWDRWSRDLALAVRGLRHAPGFAGACILILALGIGANTAVFSVVDAVLLAPLPYAQPAQLAYMWSTELSRPASQSTMSYPDFLDLRSVPGVAGMSAFAVNDIPMTGVGTASHVRAAAISSNIFDVLGVRPQFGRGFFAAEDRPGGLDGLDAAVLSGTLARQKFGTPAAAVGRHLELNGRPYVVVGVMAPGFQFPLDDHEDLWVTTAPLQVSNDGRPMTVQRSAHWMRTVVRAEPGLSLPNLELRLRARAAQLARQYPDDDGGASVRLTPMLDTYAANSRPSLLLLLGAVGCVLLIACANLAGLLLCRAVRRRREFAVRVALGASRGAIFRQLLCESLVLGTAGALAGIGAAFAGIQALVRFGPAGMVRLDQAHLSPTILAFALALGLVTALLFGMYPAWEQTKIERKRVGAVLQSGAYGGSNRQAWRRSLVAVQFAIAGCVLLTAFLLLHSLDRLIHAPLGFAPDNVLNATINIPDARYPQPDQQGRFFARLTDLLRQEPAIAGAAAAMPTPFSGNNIGVNFNWPDHPLPPQRQPHTGIGVLTPGYFGILGIPLLAGRDFATTDTHAAPQVAIVNQAFARQFFPGTSPLGRRIQPGLWSYEGSPRPVQIIGVVGDTRSASLRDPQGPMVYEPQAQVPFDGLILLVRPRWGAESAAAAAVRRVVHGARSGYTALRSRTFEGTDCGFRRAGSLRRRFARGLRLSGPAAGRRRSVCGDGAIGGAAAPRNRHSGCSGRDAKQCRA
ncbi:MAG TPA: ADOP family duplicated permease [Terriglobales bacterium]|nr:ADOP family duplicated permease [Terriglobales bacterium]